MKDALASEMARGWGYQLIASGQPNPAVEWGDDFSYELPVESSLYPPTLVGDTIVLWERWSRI